MIRRFVFGEAPWRRRASRILRQGSQASAVTMLGGADRRHA
jgi:hypothetical protein